MWLVLFKRHFFGNCFLCSCYLNTTVDTSNWEKCWHPEVLNFSATGSLQVYFIDIFGHNLWLAHQILVSGLFFRRLPPFTLWMNFPEAIKQIYPVVPRAFHSLWVFWRTSDIKAGILFFFCFKRRAVDNCNWEKLQLNLILLDFNNKKIVFPLSILKVGSNLIYRCLVV